MSKKLIPWGWLMVLLFSCQVHAKTYSVATEDDDFIARVLFDAFAYEHHLDIRFNRFDSHKAMLRSVKTGQSDFAVNITYTKERAKTFDFSDPINIEPTYLFSRQSQKHLKDFHKLGVPEEASYIPKLQQAFPSIQLRYYQNLGEARQLLAQGQIEGVVDVFSKLKPLLNDGLNAEMLNRQLLIPPTSIVTAKGHNQEILQALETFALTDKQQKMLRHSVEHYQFQLRRQALRRRVLNSGFNTQKKLTIKLFNQPRYVIYHSNGQVSGMSADVLTKACDILLLPCEIISTADEQWSSMYHNLVSGDIDVLGPIVVSKKRKQTAYFSDSFYHPKAYIIKRSGYKNGTYRDVSQLLAERVGVIKDDFFAELLHKRLPNKALLEFDSQQEMVNALLHHKIDYIVMHRISYSYALGRTPEMMPLTVDKAIGSIEQNNISFGFPKTPKGLALAQLFSDAIALIDTDKIVRKYDVKPELRSIFVIRNNYQQRIKVMSFIVFVMIIAFFLYVRRTMMTDTLTGLFSRRSLFHRFKQGVPANLCVMRIDVLNIKEVNLSFGFDVGDQALKELTKNIKKHWRGKVYRLHSTSFVGVGKMNESRVKAIIDTIEGGVYIDAKRGVDITYQLKINTSMRRQELETLHAVLKKLRNQRHPKS